MSGSINQIAEAWAGYFGLAVLQNTAFLALIFAALYVIRNAAAQTRYIVSVLGLAKLLLPPFIPTSFSELFKSSALRVGTIEIGPISLITASGDSVPLTPAVTSTTILLLIWGLVALLYLLLGLGATLILRIKLSKARQTEAGDGPFHPVKFYQSELISSPLSIGFFPKRIFLPSFWLHLPQECQSVLIDHELAHIKRKDGLVLFLQLLAQSIYFFHPLVWLLNERINEYREMACDDFAIENTKLSPVAYSRYLVHMAENSVHPHWSYTSATALIRQRHKLLNRVNYQIKEVAMKPISKKRLRLFMVLLLLFSIPLSLYSKKNAPQAINDITHEELAGLVLIEDSKFGAVTGKVSDQKTGEALPGANVFLVGTKLGAATNEKGEFSIPSVAPGKYVARAEMYGFKPVEVNVHLDENTRTTINISMLVDRGSGSEAVVKGHPEAFTKTEGKTSVEIVKDDVPQEKEFVKFDKPPEPIGGFGEIVKKLDYPASAHQAGLQGSVSVHIKVDEQGQVSDARILKSLSEDCDRAAMKALQAVPWKPAVKDGKPVAVHVTVPVVFKLDGGRKSGDKHTSRSTVEFVAYDQPPEPIGGFKAIQQNLRYPELARKAGIEGNVVVQVTIDEKGQVIDAEIMKSLAVATETNAEGNQVEEKLFENDAGCDQAAMEAIKAVKWKPAQKDGKPVQVSVSVPVVFKLK